jgi:UDP-glucose 4-epimerase
VSAAPAARLDGARVLVLGAAGFIGRWVARAAADAGASLVLGVRDRPAATSVFSDFDVRGEVIACDLRDASATRSLVHHVRPSVVFNLAGYGVDPTERDESMARQLNAELPATLVRACAEVASTSDDRPVLVHVGSALEYGTAHGELAEDGPASPTTLYGRTKLDGTLAVGRLSSPLGVRACTARLFTVYGPGEHAGRLLPSLLEAARGDGPVPLTEGLQRRDFAYVVDVAEALVRLAVSPVEPGEVVNVASGSMQSVRRFVDVAASLLGISPDRLRFGALATRPEEMRNTGVRLDRLRALVGGAPSPSIERGIERTIEVLRALEHRPSGARPS